jgi:hypothetical protein
MKMQSWRKVIVVVYPRSGINVATLYDAKGTNIGGVQEVNYEHEPVSQNRGIDSGGVASDEYPVIGGDYGSSPATFSATSSAEYLHSATHRFRTNPYGSTDSSILNLWSFRSSLPSVFRSLRQL